MELWPNALGALAALAEVFVQQGRKERALEISFHVLKHPMSTHDAKKRTERLREELEKHLPPQQFEVVQARARSATFDQLARELFD